MSVTDIVALVDFGGLVEVGVEGVADSYAGRGTVNVDEGFDVTLVGGVGDNVEVDVTLDGGVGDGVAVRLGDNVLRLTSVKSTSSGNGGGFHDGGGGRPRKRLKSADIFQPRGFTNIFSRNLKSHQEMPMSLR